VSLHAVILAGGSGTRFWPLSRSNRPKQFLPLVTEKTLIAETFLRVEPLCPAERIWVVCGQEHAALVRAELPRLPDAHLIVEPAARNTAPAIGLASLRVGREDPDATLLVLPSDHHVKDPAGFRAGLELAARACQGGDLLTIGIRPTRPETGYGYLRVGPRRADGAYAVDAFVEKPDAATAARYLQEGGYLWNGGIFVFRAAAILDALGRHLPAVHAGLEKDFAALASISIDYGVMEPESQTTRRIALVSGDFGWSDVGSFAALPDVRALDDKGNAVSGDVVTIDCDGCVVLSEGKRLVAAVGLSDLCIIDAGDALLVVPRDRAQDVRAVVDALRASGRTDKL